MSEQPRLEGLDALPPLPYVAHEVLLAVNQQGSHLGDIASILGKEPGLTARIVAMANSAFFAHQRPVYSPEDAIVRLGLNRVRVLAASILLAQQFDPSQCPGFATASYWFEAVGTAFCAARLAQHCGLAEQEDAAYLGGLLHNIGLLLLVHTFPVELNRLLERRQADADLSLAALTREALGADYREAGRLLLREWGLPAQIVATAAHHHQIDYRGEHAPLVQMVGYAARWARSGFETQPLAPPCELGEAALQRVAQACRREREQMEAFASLLAGA